MTAGAALLSGMGMVGAADLLNSKTNKMKIVVLTGSPRRSGNTNRLAGQFIKGAEEAGHEVYRFDCAQHKVSPCIACNRCGMNARAYSMMISRNSDRTLWMPTWWCLPRRCTISDFPHS